MADLFKKVIIFFINITDFDNNDVINLAPVEMDLDVQRRIP
jgi:hypothetical protein